MSTPQDNPDNGPRDGQGWTAPGPSERSQPAQPGPGTGSQGQPGQPGQYGRGNKGGHGYSAAQPSGYAYPTTGEGLGTSGKGPAPKEVERAYYLILAAGILYLVSTVISSLTIDVPNMAGGAVAVAIAMVLAVAMTAIYIVLAVFIRKGHNWARIIATVLAALNVIVVVGLLALLPLLEETAAANDQMMVETSPLSTIMDILVMLLGVAGVVMTYLKPARPYFAAKPLGY